MKEILEQTNKSVCLALGFFDSLHVAHREIIQGAINYAKKLGCKSAVFTFKDEGIARFKGDMIYLYDERKEMIADMGVDYLIPYVFNEKCISTSKETFLQQITTLLNVKAIFCGYDFTFGYKGEGNVEYLQKFCLENQIELFVTPKASALGKKISSTMIKKLLQDGEIEKANTLLTIPYSVTSTVVKGRGEGHLFGLPTANLSLNIKKLKIKEGVYGTYTTLGGKRYLSVTNVGKKPTFDDTSISIETFIKDFSGDIYGESIKVSFVKFIRSIKKFDNAQDLKTQISKDLEWEKCL